MKNNEAKKKKNEIVQSGRWNEIAIEITLAIITVISLPSTILSIGDNVEKEFFWKMIVAIVVTIVVAILLFIFYKNKIDINKKSYISESEYIREQKINQINKVVFDSLYKSNSTKVREVFRYTYGKVPEWNPINYRDNVLVYDVHEQIRSILISIEEVVINIDPERFNEKNVSVELVYCYPRDAKKTTLPLGKEFKKRKDILGN